MISLEDHVQGVLLKVRAQPNARKNTLLGDHHGALKIAVTAPPEDGKANAALIELLAETLQLRRSDIELLRGSTNRDKTFLLRGQNATTIRARLAALGVAV
ncbi:MAG: DUF167 domain-containing protein [Gemmataceae bacterium]